MLLVGPRLERGARAAVRSRAAQPAGRPIARAARDLRLTRGELARYLPEPRADRARPRCGLPAARELVVGCVHCHNARHPEVVGREIARAAEAVREAAGDGPAVLAGDLNARPRHAAVAALAAGGLGRRRRPAPGIGIDRILHRGLEIVERGRGALPPAEREVAVTWGGRTRRLRLSDHDPVVATLALAPSGRAHRELGHEQHDQHHRRRGPPSARGRGSRAEPVGRAAT